MIDIKEYQILKKKTVRIYVIISYMKHSNAIKISGSDTLIPALSMTRGIVPSSDERKRGRQKGKKKKRRKEKNQKKNGRTCRDCLDMHVALAVGLKIRQLSGGILASS